MTPSESDVKREGVYEPQRPEWMKALIEKARAAEPDTVRIFPHFTRVQFGCGCVQQVQYEKERVVVVTWRPCEAHAEEAVDMLPPSFKMTSRHVDSRAAFAVPDEDEEAQP